MNKRNLKNVFENVTLSGLILTVLPFIFLSVYSHPCWDDFEYSELARELGFFESQRNWYYTWTGRFFSTAFLSTLNPLVYRSVTGYKILMMVFLVLFIISIYLLISELLSEKITKKHKLIFSLLVCFLYFTGMPSMKLGFFWLSTAVIYQLANIMMAVILALLLKSEIKNSKGSDIFQNIIICFLIIAVCGSNEVAMIMLMMFLFFILILNYTADKKISKRFLLFNITALISFLAVYVSPGNVQRFGKQPNSHHFLYSVKHTLIDLTGLFFFRNISIPFIVISILFILILLKTDLRSIFKFNPDSVNPFYSITAYLLILSAGYFTSYWSLGIPPFERITNVIYFVYLLGWFFNIIIIINYVKRKLSYNLKQIPSYAYAFTFSVTCLALLLTNNSIKNSYKDIYRGTAVSFDSEMNKRYEYIYQDIADTCIVKSIKNVPSTLFYHDLSDDHRYKYNKLEAKYFGKKFIIARDTVK
ncbi:MAG TPA: DUF6056 family protein [Ignavibacteria bacterium]|nr:DUF6056 family protein [Ignavibacteria bacterium]